MTIFVISDMYYMENGGDDALCTGTLFVIMDHSDTRNFSCKELN